MNNDSLPSAEIELVTQEIAEGKHYLIELDRRQNQYREARRVLLKQKTDEDTFILCNGSTFVRNEIGIAGAVLFFDEKIKESEKEIEAARLSLKKNVAELAALEGPDSALAQLYKGFGLKKM